MPKKKTVRVAASGHQQRTTMVSAAKRASRAIANGVPDVEIRKVIEWAKAKLNEPVSPDPAVGSSKERSSHPGSAVERVTAWLKGLQVSEADLFEVSPWRPPENFQLDGAMFLAGLVAVELDTQPVVAGDEDVVFAADFALASALGLHGVFDYKSHKDGKKITDWRFVVRDNKPASKKTSKRKLTTHEPAVAVSATPNPVIKAAVAQLRLELYGSHLGQPDPAS